MTSGSSLFPLGGLLVAILVLRARLKGQHSKRHPNIEDKAFIAELKARRADFSSRSILDQRKRIASALAVPYKKLDPHATREELIESFSVFGDVSFGWADLEEEVADSLGIPVEKMRVRTVADLVEKCCETDEE